MGSLLTSSILVIGLLASGFQAQPAEVKIDLPESLKRQFEELRDHFEDFTSLKTQTSSKMSRVRLCTVTEFGYETTYRSRDVSRRGLVTTVEMSQTGTIPWAKIKEVKVLEVNNSTRFEARVFFKEQIELKVVSKIEVGGPVSDRETKPDEDKVKASFISFEFEKRSEARKFTELFDAFRTEISKVSSQ